jgi:hypothetical protein
MRFARGTRQPERPDRRHAVTFFGGRFVRGKEVEMRKHVRGWMVVGLAIAVLVPVGIAYGRSRVTTVLGTRASCVDWAAVTSPVSTTSTTWTNVPGVLVKDVLAQNFAVQVSGTFDGSRPQLRVRDASVGGTFTLDPGETTASVGSTPTAFSFTWVGQNPAEHQHTFRLQWRSPSGGSATMDAGDITLLYQGAPTPASC